MALGDLGRPTGIPVQGYGEQLNGDLKRAQATAYRHADDANTSGLGLDDEAFEAWTEAFDAKMRELGYQYTGDHCMCEWPEDGHEPACGWSNVSPSE